MKTDSIALDLFLRSLGGLSLGLGPLLTHTNQTGLAAGLTQTTVGRALDGRDLGAVDFGDRLGRGDVLDGE